MSNRADLEIEIKSRQTTIQQIGRFGNYEVCDVLDRRIEEVANQLQKMDSKKEQEIREIAHRIWLDAGRPDGEKLVYSNGQMIKLKDLHWEVAVVEWTYGPDYMRSW